jgi:Ca2+-binding RTX toxin-like protein
MSIAPAVLAVVALTARASLADAAPSCAEGPQTVSDTIVGTPCEDTIHAPRGITTVYGEGGDDTIYGGRGNESLYGGAGNDRLYGGPGDDHLRGGPADDLLSGGFGADSLDGEGGSDYARGDATIDAIWDSGGPADTDTLSFATGATPGFFNKASYPDFSVFDGLPTGRDGRGVYVNLATGKGDNGLAPDGGGVDEEVAGVDFETVVGTPFSDYIVGTSAKQTIYGGGGADVLLGEGGGDTLDGGAEGDYCGSGESFVSCEFAGEEEEIEPRDPSGVAAGLTSGPGALSVYLTGSDGDDDVSVAYSEGLEQVTFELSGSASFDTSATEEGGCVVPMPGRAECPAAQDPDSIVLAGLAGDDSISASGFPATTSIVQLGGKDDDELGGTGGEDVLVDGPGNDLVSAAAGDDALPNNQGADRLDAEAGDDLFISDAVCEGDLLDGGAGRDNANWAKFGLAVSLDLETRTAGLPGAGGLPECGDAPPTSLRALEDLEGSDLGDTLIGDAGSNQLLGRPGADSYFARAGDDSILANSGDSDAAIDCGAGFDTAQIDIPTAEYADPPPIDCEAIHERPPNSFRPPDTPPGPDESPSSSPSRSPASTPPPQASSSLTAPARLPRDVTPPRTHIRHRPHRVVFARHRWRRVAFVFTASEPGARFRCKLDRRRFRGCRSPRRYRVRAGRHVFRVYAVNAAGKRDRSPAVFRFRVRRRR